MNNEQASRYVGKRVILYSKLGGYAPVGTLIEKQEGRTRFALVLDDGSEDKVSVGCVSRIAEVGP